MSHVLAKSKKVTLKESFGEENGSAFFKLFVDGKICIGERGKRIKTLRKKAYKRLLHVLTEMEEKNQREAEEAYEKMKV
jgi:hypothetical protein